MKINLVTILLVLLLLFPLLISLLIGTPDQTRSIVKAIGTTLGIDN
ncbi:hypothetical protein JOC86_000310 [Bacillus pakistanensis]|uniref:Uncharacterized protein n=1 Tax=Rossellomorea pakistanensis TaxID=992288 RepID=A0ABS2N7E2_9BACI|nr:hypothetical protein [Bacillus pakistanensis]MBM7583773.1 hypothetical protein [Bacillus pakistanensis]